MGFGVPRGLGGKGVAERCMQLLSASTNAARWRSKPASQRSAGFLKTLAQVQGIWLEDLGRAAGRSQLSPGILLTATEGRTWYLGAMEQPGFPGGLERARRSGGPKAWHIL